MTPHLLQDVVRQPHQYIGSMQMRRGTFSLQGLSHWTAAPAQRLPAFWCQIGCAAQVGGGILHAWQGLSRPHHEACGRCLVALPASNDRSRLHIRQFSIIFQPLIIECALGAVHTRAHRVLFELISKELLTSFEIALTSNMLRSENRGDFELRLHHPTS